jgi:hypothetical protein
MSSKALNFLKYALVGAAFAAASPLLPTRQPAAPSPAPTAEVSPSAGSCGPPPPPVVKRRPRPEEEGCAETPPSPALAQR